MRHSTSTQMCLLILCSLAAVVSAGWPANHINSLSDIRCRQWCSFRFREGSRAVFVGRDAEIRRFLVDDYVKRTQDRHAADVDNEMRENRRQFRDYYSRLASRRVQPGQDRTMHWFNLYQDYLHCLKECFAA